MRTPRGYPRGVPMHVSCGWRVWPPPLCIQHRAEAHSPAMCMPAQGARIGPPPLCTSTQSGGYGGCCATAANPHPVTEGLWECCNSCTRAAAHVPLLVHPVCCCSSGFVATLPTYCSCRNRCHAAPVVLQLHHSPPPPCYQPRGSGGGGAGGGGAGG